MPERTKSFVVATSTPSMVLDSISVIPQPVEEPDTLQQIEVTATSTSLPLYDEHASLIFSDSNENLRFVGSTLTGGDLLNFDNQDESLYFLNRIEQTIYQIHIADLGIQKVITKTSFLQSAMVFTSSANNHLAIGVATSPTGIVAEHSQENVFLLEKENLNILDTYYSTIRSLSFSSDGRLLAIASEDTEVNPNGVTIWDVLDNNIVAELPTDDLGFYAVSAFFIDHSPNTLIISAMSTDFENSKGGLYIWDIQQNDVQQIIAGDFASSIALSSNGQLAAVVIDGYLQVLDVSSRGSTANTPFTSFRSNLVILNSGNIIFLDQQQKLNLLINSQSIALGMQEGIAILDVIATHLSQIIISAYSEEDGYLIEVWEVVEN